MPAPVTPAELEALLPKETDDLCEVLVKAGQFDAAMSRIYRWLVNEDLTLNTEFTDSICAACGGGDATSTSTTSTSTTTTVTTTSTTTGTTGTTTTPVWGILSAPTTGWNDLAISADGAVVIATPSGTAPMYVSTDSGATWVARNSSINYKGCAASEFGVKLYAGSRVGIVGKLWRSANSGLTWASVDIGSDVTAVACNGDGSEVLVTDGDVVYQSLDSGASFSTIFDAANGGNAYYSGLCISEDDSVAYVLFRGVSDKLYKSNADRSVWTLCAGASDIVGTDVYGVACSTEGDTVLVAAGNHFYLSLDGGASFTEVAYGGGYNWDASMSADGLYMLVANDDTLAKSNNTGGTWSPDPIAITDIEAVVVARDGFSRYAASNSGGIYKRTT